MPTNPPTTAMPRLRMQGVAKSFGATRALAGVDLDVQPGEVHALVGENGAGKSTLMKILAGAERADAGQMWLDGRPYEPRHPADGRRAGVAMIYQELSLAPHLSVAENILLGVEPAAGPFVRRGLLRRRAAEALAQLGHADLPLDAPVGRLSTAAQQLVEIARGVAVGCRVLVLDEPTSSLTQPDVHRLFALIRRLRAGGVSVLYISHVLEEVLEISDRYTVLRDGRCAGGGATSGARVGDIIALMVGRQVRELYPRTPRTPGEVVVALDKLAGLRLPQEASLELRRGEVLGIAGLIGAGRTELLRAVFGLDAVRGGGLRVAGLVGWCSPARRWAQGVGLVSEDRQREGLAVNLGIADNVTLAGLRHISAGGFVRPASQRAAAAPWIERLQIKCLGAGQPVRDLSGGNQQKVALARLLHADADILLLDEPTRGIDVGSKAQIYELIDRLAAGHGGRPRAVLLVSSYLPELLGVCDRIAVMCRGRLSPARPTAEWDEHQIMHAATA